MEELRVENEGQFRNLLRIEPVIFHKLLDHLTPHISKHDTHYRKAIELGLRLALTLRHLDTGESYHSLHFGFKVPHNTYSIIVRQVCEAIVDEFAEELIKCPSTQEEWKDVADKLKEQWNFHHAVGAIDGKHISTKKTGKSGLLFYNYKGFFSIILLAVVDKDYKFMWVDIGANGSSSDFEHVQ